MPRWLDASDPAFAYGFRELLNSKREQAADVTEDVLRILDDVRKRGDAALFELTEKFDRIDVRATGLAIPLEDAKAAFEALAPDVRAALELAASRIEAYHKVQMPADHQFTDETGTRLGWRWRAVASAGLYVPGGTASYPSSMLMNAIPAKVAGVKRLVMTVPTPGGKVDPVVLAAAHLCGVDEIYRVGGAQAIGALAYGTDTIAPVDAVVGPGNAYVAAAKRFVYGQVGIDMIAGPSEILVVADADNDPDWIAADLLSQAEHDISSQSILITDSRDFATRVEQAVDEQLSRLPRKDIAGPSWRDYGAIILVPGFDEAVPLVDALAPEHLEIAVADPEAFLEKVTHAGAIFVGKYTPEAVGDYVAGSNHVLPTARSARYASGLSVYNFLKRTSILSCSPDALAKLGPAAMTLAEHEGLDAHKRSISLRLK